MPDQTFAKDAPLTLAERIKRHIESKTFRRVRRLRVACDGNRVTVRGQAASYYAKQLALAAVRDLLPDAVVNLDIQVR